MWGPRPADRTRKLTVPSRMLTSVPSCMEGLASSAASARTAARPPAVLVARPHVADVRHHLAREEVRVVEDEVFRHRADLEQHHQVADAERADALRELLADGGRAPRDDVALVEVLLPVERLADLLGLGADPRLCSRLERLYRAVARRLGEALPDAQALLVKIMHVREVHSFRFCIGGRHRHEL